MAGKIKVEDVPDLQRIAEGLLDSIEPMGRNLQKGGLSVVAWIAADQCTVEIRLAGAPIMRRERSLETGITRTGASS